MNRKNISSGAVWEDVVGYSRAVRIDNIIEVSGTTAVDNDKVISPGNVYEQAVHSLKKIEKAIVEAGGNLNDVIRTRMYITDISLWEEAARAHALFFKTIKPATSMVEVSALINPDLVIEIEATAIVRS